MFTFKWGTVLCGKFSLVTITLNLANCGYCTSRLLVQHTQMCICYCSQSMCYSLYCDLVCNVILNGNNSPTVRCIVSLYAIQRHG